MVDDNARGVREKRHLEHVAGVDDAAVECASPNFVNAEEAVLRIQE
jgi:hypothetical protein